MCKRTVSILFLILAAALVSADALAQNNAKAKLEGGWLTTVVDPEGGEIKTRFTFAPASTTREGSLIFTTEQDAGPVFFCAPDTGVWKKTGNREFTTSHEAFCQEEGTPLILKSRDRITLNPAGDAFTGTQLVQGFDTDGNLLFEVEVMLHGTRMNVNESPLTAPDSVRAKPSWTHRWRAPARSLR
jgi:hypothetical protein